MRLLEWKIGFRYTRSKRRNHIASFISVVSILGIAVGVAALMTVMAAMNGFETELKTRILQAVSHITVESFYSQLSGWETVRNKVRNHSGVIGVAPYIESELMVLSGDHSGGVMIRGIDPGTESEVSDLQNKLVDGSVSSLSAGKFNVFIGRALAEKMGLKVGDKLTLVTSRMRVTAAGVIPRVKRFTISGIFEIGMYNYDMRLVIIHIDDAARLLGFGRNVSGLRVRLENPDQATLVNKELLGSLGHGYWGLEWSRRHRNLFSAIELQKGVMFIILSLVIGVAAFNLVATLIMVVNDKRGDIAIMRTMGLTRGAVIRIFMIQGALIGVFGTIIGLILGAAISLNLEHIVSWLEGFLGVDLVARDVYLITTLPAKIALGDVFMTVAITLILSVLATIYPAWRASSISPAQALSYE